MWFLAFPSFVVQGQLAKQTKARLLTERQARHVPHVGQYYALLIMKKLIQRPSLCICGYFSSSKEKQIKACIFKPKGSAWNHVSYV